MEDQIKWKSEEGNVYSVTQSAFSSANKTPLFPFLSYAHAHVQSLRSILTSAALLNPSDGLVKASYCNTFKVSYFPFTARTMYTRIASRSCCVDSLWAFRWIIQCRVREMNKKTFSPLDQTEKSRWIDIFIPVLFLLIVIWHI